MESILSGEELTPETRIEGLLLGEEIVPKTRLEMYYAAMGGQSVELPEPKTRLELFLAKAAGMSVETPDPVTRIEMFLSEWSGGGSVELTATGNAPVTLANAIAHAIVSLTQNGKVTQADTPTPSAPVPIVCNNGTLKMVDDELPSGYKRVLGFTCDNNAVWEITNFHLKGSDTVRISFSVTAGCNVFGCYQGADATDNYDLYVSTSSGSKYLRYGDGTYLSYWSPDDLGQRFDVVYTPTGSSGMPQDSTWTPRTFTSENNLLIGSTTLTGTSSKLRGDLYGNIIVDGRLKLIPCERVSDHILGYYDTYSATFYEPYEGYDGAVSLGYDGSHYSLATVGTPEVLSLAPVGSSTQDGTPSPTNPVPIVSTKMGDTVLRAIGDAEDEYDPATQTITRRIGVKVLYGTEEWGRSQGIFYLAGVTPAPTEDSDHTCLCTHFIGVNYADGTPAAQSDKIYVGNPYFSDRMLVYPNLLNEAGTAVISLDEWKAWLAEQNTNGTPVTVYYPLAEPTTEAYAGAPVGGTATVADLFAVGNYKDTQEIIGGTVTRKCGVWVLTGEENWTVASSNSNVYYLSSTYFPDDYGVVTRFTPICSHLVGTLSTVSIADMTANTIKTNNSSKIIYACVGADYTKDEWKEFIANQYAFGTPVIIVYPLDEETTEQVTPQALHTTAGTNTVSVTSEVDPVTLTVVYKGTEEGGD